MKATSTKSISFPKLNWGINAGEVKELPEDKEAQARILAEPEISEVKAPPPRKIRLNNYRFL
jgi:hypothetical protein